MARGLVNEAQGKLAYICLLPSLIQRLFCPLLGLGRFSSFVILCTVGKTPWKGDQTVVRLLPTE
jgi:hypothetical protein